MLTLKSFSAQTLLHVIIYAILEMTMTDKLKVTVLCSPNGRSISWPSTRWTYTPGVSTLLPLLRSFRILLRILHLENDVGNNLFEIVQLHCGDGAWLQKPIKVEKPPIMAEKPIHWRSIYMKNTKVITPSVAITTWNVFCCIMKKQVKNCRKINTTISMIKLLVTMTHFKENFWNLTEFNNWR